jgi:predicted RNA-binding Zn-ribbon protein involved in translation (DUF1610 family)
MAETPEPQLPQAPKSCPRCGKQVELGFLLDSGERSGLSGKVNGQAIWVEGEPDAGWLGVKIGQKVQRHITAFRCTSCGGVDLYAH